jgi:hypothetical protein
MLLDDAALAPDPTRQAAFVRAWSALVGPGPLLTAAQRVSVIGAARRSWEGAAGPDPQLGALGEAVHWLAVDAGGITKAAIDDLEARGLDRLAYLEVVGITSRLSNIDFYATGLGAARPVLPANPDTAPATGNVAADAAIRDMWVHQSGPVRAPMVIDALPDEGVAFRDLHEPMYMPFQQIFSWDYGDTLTRPQYEYVAARVSYLNECFY